MPTYSIIVEVLQTRAYMVRAEDIEQAEEIVRDEYEAMPYDTLENSLENLEVCEAN